jgi:hypothetical protein
MYFLFVPETLNSLRLTVATLIGVHLFKQIKKNNISDLPQRTGRKRQQKEATKMYVFSFCARDINSL